MIIVCTSCAFVNSLQILEWIDCLANSHGKVIGSLKCFNLSAIFDGVKHQWKYKKSISNLWVWEFEVGTMIHSSTAQWFHSWLVDCNCINVFIGFSYAVWTYSSNLNVQLKSGPIPWSLCCIQLIKNDHIRKRKRFLCLLFGLESYMILGSLPGVLDDTVLLSFWFLSEFWYF